MKQAVTPKELKTILHSKRSDIRYLEKCSVCQKDGRVVYLTSEEKRNEYYNIPVASTSVLLLGMGTSITQSAVRMLASAGVAIAFCGTGGTPLLSACAPGAPNTDADAPDVPNTFLPQNEYRITKYMQGWVHFWYDDAQRLEGAKIFQRERIAFLQEVWKKHPLLQEYGFLPENADISEACSTFLASINGAMSITDLLLSEAAFTKRLYKAAAERTDMTGFFRDYHGKDPVNSFLTHGNYLAYGLGATCCWVLGLSHAFPLMHGKTRRGGLVFDIADLIKDILILPFAFIYADKGMTQQEFRQDTVARFNDFHALDHMFDIVEAVAIKWPWNDNKGAEDHAGNLYVHELEERTKNDGKRPRPVRPAHRESNVGSESDRSID